MLLVGTCLALGSLLLTIINALTIKKPIKSRLAQAAPVSILIPMRNESINVLGVLSSVDLQNGLTNYEIITLNDGSTDNTETLISGYQFKANSLAIQGQVLPNGWLGKNFACHQLAGASNSKYLVFLDADRETLELQIREASRLLRPGGVIAIAHALWRDRVPDPAIRDEATGVYRDALRFFVNNDDVITTLSPVGDGLLLASKHTL